MTNAEVAAIFNDIADLLEISGGDAFKVRAYRNAARAIEYLSDSVLSRARAGTLQEIPGIGKAIAEKITELAQTGRMEYHEKLKASLPAGVTELLRVPGVGPKLARRLASEADVHSLDELEAAILDGRVASLPRVGEKSAQTILENLQALRSKTRRLPIAEVEPQATRIVDQLRNTGLLRNLSLAGSLRRRKPTIRDVDIIGTADDPAAVMQAFVTMPGVHRVLSHGDTKSSVLLDSGLQVDLRLVEHQSWGSLLQHFTGSKEHNVALREYALRRGLSLSEYGITEIATRKQYTFATEEDFYRFLGLRWIPPEQRENQGEIEAARLDVSPVPA